MKSLVPQQIAPPFGRYSHGVEVPAGARWVRSSGQLALDASGQTPEGAEAQADLIFTNLDAILSAGEMRREHVVHLTAYVTDKAHMAGYMAARDRWLAGVARLPASTLVIVSGFTRPEFLVEVEVVAAVVA